MARYILVPAQNRPRVALASEKDGGGAADRFADDCLERLDKRFAISVLDRFGNSAQGIALASDHSDDERLRITCLPSARVLLLQSADEAIGPELKREKDVIEQVIRTDYRGTRLPHSADTTEVMSDPIDTWHLEALGIPGRVGRGESTWIGIIDSGIDPKHPEFEGKTIQFAEFDRDGHQIPGAGAHDVDPLGHGTHVAASAAGNRGVASGANLAIALAVHPRGSTPEQIINAADWLMDLPRPDGRTGVDVINMSFVTVRYMSGLTVANYAREYEPVIARLRERGITVVAAIGNSGADSHGSPGNYPYVIGVGAVDKNGDRWPKSCCGVIGRPNRKRYKPDFVAPGVDVLSANRGGGYVRKTGTSHASPLVAGVAALATEQTGRRELARWQLRNWSVPIRVGPHGRDVRKITL